MSDFNNKLYICSTNNDPSLFSNGTIFSFKQYDHLIQASFKGEKITHGELVGLINKNGVLEFSLNYQMFDHQVYGGVGTLKECYSTGSYLQGCCSVTNGYETVECSFSLEKLSLQTRMAVRRKKTC